MSLLRDVINTACCDKRIENGVINLSNPEHLLIVEDYLIKAGFSEKLVTESLSPFINEKGNFPERQAYNKDGILVTFPNAEYKRKAIQKGTHFEKNPNPFKQHTRSTGDGNIPQVSQIDYSLFDKSTDADNKTGNFQIIPNDKDSILLTTDLQNSGTGLSVGDLRTRKEKIVDAEAVQALFGTVEPTMTE